MMSSVFVDCHSGQHARYQREVAPLERKLRHNTVFNSFICIVLLLGFAIAGVAVGYVFLPTLVGMFFGLLIGAIAGFGSLMLFYFLRGICVEKTKKVKNEGLISCEENYRNSFAIPSDATEITVLGSNFLGKEFFAPSYGFLSADGYRIAAKNYHEERELLLLNADSVIGVLCCQDGRVLVKTEQGYLLLPAETKDAILSLPLPLLPLDLGQRIMIESNTISESRRPLDPITIPAAPVNATWREAVRDISMYLKKENA